MEPERILRNKRNDSIVARHSRAGKGDNPTQDRDEIILLGDWPGLIKRGGARQFLNWEIYEHAKRICRRTLPNLRTFRTYWRRIREIQIVPTFVRRFVREGCPNFKTKWNTKTKKMVYSDLNSNRPVPLNLRKPGSTTNMNLMQSRLLMLLSQRPLVENVHVSNLKSARIKSDQLLIRQILLEPIGL